jgi:non-specific serine/threonine protein kinase/serine/threonine-protein kinase
MIDLGARLAEEVPRHLGPYTILERIGEGGMGVVYLAEQAPPLVRAWRSSSLERPSRQQGPRAVRVGAADLAVMNHPSIAARVRRGSAPRARPYFVMEYVAGESITEFCDARRLGIDARLELFLRVCDGVQHAHVNAVIHRDLKPSNILVTERGRRTTRRSSTSGSRRPSGRRPAGSEPDAVRPDRRDAGVHEPRAGGPRRASGGHAHRRLRAGVVLYELLVGSRPFERNRSEDASFIDLCRRIREEEPERPSSRAARASTAIAAARGAVPRTSQAAAGRPRRDRDEGAGEGPAGRYATASDLAEDVEKHLRHHPIGARRPGSLVRLRKLVRRHRAATAVIASLSIAIIAVTIVGSVMALRARQERAAADGIRDFLLGVLDPPEPVATRERRPSLIDTSDRKVLLDRIREQFADQPLLLADLLLAAGNSPAFDNSQPDLLLQEARDRFVSLLGPDSPQALVAAASLGRRWAESGRFPRPKRS